MNAGGVSDMAAAEGAPVVVPATVELVDVAKRVRMLVEPQRDGALYQAVTQFRTNRVEQMKSEVLRNLRGDGENARGFKFRYFYLEKESGSRGRRGPFVLDGAAFVRPAIVGGSLEIAMEVSHTISCLGCRKGPRSLSCEYGLCWRCCHARDEPCEAHKNFKSKITRDELLVLEHVDYQMALAPPSIRHESTDSGLRLKVIEAIHLTDSGVLNDLEKFCGECKITMQSFENRTRFVVCDTSGSPADDWHSHPRCRARDFPGLKQGLEPGVFGPVALAAGIWGSFLSSGAILGSHGVQGARSPLKGRSVDQIKAMLDDEVDKFVDLAPDGRVRLYLFDNRGTGGACDDWCEETHNWTTTAVTVVFNDDFLFVHPLSVVASVRGQGCVSWLFAPLVSLLSVDVIRDELRRRWIESEERGEAGFVDASEATLLRILVGVLNLGTSWNLIDYKHLHAASRSASDGGGPRSRVCRARPWRTTSVRELSDA